MRGRRQCLVYCIFFPGCAHLSLKCFAPGAWVWVVRHSASLSVSLSFPAGVTQCAWGAFSCLSSRWGYPFSFESLRTSSRCFLWAAGEVHRSQSSVWRTSHLVEWGNHWEALGGRRLQGACILRNIIKGTNEKWRNNHALFRVWTMPWVLVWNER